MFKFFSRLKIRQKLVLLISIFLLGYIITAVISELSQDTIRVNGPIYNNIIREKDLVADISSPKEYIIESYLLVLQMLNETDTSKLSGWMEKSKTLRDAYETRHQFWAESLLEKKELDKKIKELIVVDAYNAAEEFYNTRDRLFIPAIQNSDIKEASNLAAGILKQKFEEHKQKMEEAVGMVSESNKADIDATNKTISDVNIILTLLSIVMFVSAILIGIIIHRSFKPLTETTRILKGISEGSGDLTKRININCKDEIGDMALYFNKFIDKLQEMMKRVQSSTLLLGKASKGLLKVSDNMTSDGKQVSNKANHVNETISNIVARISSTASSIDDANANMHIVAEAVEEISSTIRNLASASEEISHNVGNVDNLAVQISSSINNVSDSSKDVSASVNSIVTAVKEINLSLNEVGKSCTRSIQITSSAGQNAKDTNTIIGKLNNSSKQIGQIINVINDIADQTNMLALNAAIEAAGAGEAGKGFAVVANEVKELAKQTAEATDEISQQIEDMHDNMSEAVKAVETITQVIEEIMLITNTIAASVNEQSATTGEISDAVVKSAEKVNRITKEIEEVSNNSKSVTQSISVASNGVKEIARSSMELSNAANGAAKSTDKIASVISGVAKSSDEIVNGVNEISKNIQEINMVSASTASGAAGTSSSAKDLAEMAKNLEILVQQFKV